MSPALLDEALKLKGTAREQIKRCLMSVFFIMLVTRRGVVKEIEKNVKNLVQEERRLVASFLFLPF
jgi:hypothetical protein